MIRHMMDVPTTSTDTAHIERSTETENQNDTPPKVIILAAARTGNYRGACIYDVNKNNNGNILSSVVINSTRIKEDKIADSSYRIGVFNNTGGDAYLTVVNNRVSAQNVAISMLDSPGFSPKVEYGRNHTRYIFERTL